MFTVCKLWTSGPGCGDSPAPQFANCETGLTTRHLDPLAVGRNNCGSPVVGPARRAGRTNWESRHLGGGTGMSMRITSENVQKSQLPQLFTNHKWQTAPSICIGGNCVICEQSSYRSARMVCPFGFRDFEFCPLHHRSEFDKIPTEPHDGLLTDR